MIADVDLRVLGVSMNQDVLVLTNDDASELIGLGETRWSEDEIFAR